MTRFTRIFVVDPDPATASQVRSAVDSLGPPSGRPRLVEVQWFSSAEDFLAQLEPGDQGVVVTELALPGASGLELHEHLAGRFQVVFLTARASVAVAVAAMRRGAVTLLEKPASLESLGDALRWALEHPTAGAATLTRVDAGSAEIPPLTNREREILNLILAGKPNKAIARRMELGLRTVEACRQQIFRKTRTRSLAELVRLIVAAEISGQPLVGPRVAEPNVSDWQPRGPVERVAGNGAARAWGVVR